MVSPERLILIEREIKQEVKGCLDIPDAVEIAFKVMGRHCAMHWAGDTIVHGVRLAIREAQKLPKEF